VFRTVVRVLLSRCFTLDSQRLSTFPNMHTHTSVEDSVSTVGLKDATRYSCGTPSPHMSCIEEFSLRLDFPFSDACKVDAPRYETVLVRYAGSLEKADTRRWTPPNSCRYSPGLPGESSCFSSLCGFFLVSRASPHKLSMLLGRRNLTNETEPPVVAGRGHLNPSSTSSVQNSQPMTVDRPASQRLGAPLIPPWPPRTSSAEGWNIKKD